MYQIRKTIKEDLLVIKFLYKKILKIYPFLTKTERSIFEKKSGSILGKFTRDKMTAEEAILKLLSFLKNGHADIKEYHKPDRKFMRKVKPQRVPSFEFRNRILYIKIPSWLVWLGEIDKTLIRFCQKNINKYDAVIIDTRENQGGHSLIAHNFAGIFFKKSVLYGKFIKKGSNGKLITFTDKLEPNGKIFIDKLIAILISEKCFSSNELFLAPFKISKRAVLIGKTTRGGSAHSMSEIIECSGKKFIVRIPTWRFFLKGKNQPIEKTKIRPDIYYNKKDIEKFAEKYLLKKLNKNSKTAESNCTEIDAELRKLLSGRKLKEAEKLARMNIKKFIDAKSIYGLGLTLATIGFLKNIDSKKKEAQQCYRELIKKFPETMHACLAKARIKEENHKPKEAIPFYKKTFNMCPTALNAIHVANIYRQLNKIPIARKYYLIAEKIKKGSAIKHLKSLEK